MEMASSNSNSIADLFAAATIHRKSFYVTTHNRAPALFLEWSDCQRYLRDDDTENKECYRQFSTLSDAIQFLIQQDNALQSHGQVEVPTPAEAIGTATKPHGRDNHQDDYSVEDYLTQIEHAVEDRMNGKPPRSQKHPPSLDQKQASKPTPSAVEDSVTHTTPQSKRKASSPSAQKTVKRKRPPPDANSNSATPNETTVEEPKRPASTSQKARKKQKYRHMSQMNWEEIVNKLLAYKLKYGNFYVPKHLREENSDIIGWIEDLRSLKRRYLENPDDGIAKEIMQKGCIQILEQNDFPWTSSGTFAHRNWNEMFAELKAFKEKNGHFKVAHLGPDLKRFVNDIKRRYTKLQNDPDARATDTILTPERIAQIDGIGFTWKKFTRGPNLWEENFEKIQAYKEKYGHCRVSRHHDRSLWGWVKTQRTRYREFMEHQETSRKPAPEGTTAGRSGLSLMKPEEIGKLQMIGFEWSTQKEDNDASWERHFVELLKYKSIHGHAHVPKAYPQLGLWCHGQRAAYARRLKRGPPPKSVLTEERIARLNEIEFPWFPKEHNPADGP